MPDFGGLIDPQTFILGGLFDQQSDPTKLGYMEYVKDGQLIRQGVDASGKASGGIISTTPLPKAVNNAVPKQPIITTDPGDNSKWATSFNPDGTIKAQVQVTPPTAPAATATSGSTNALHDAEAQRVGAQMAAAEALAPFNKDLAAQRIAKLQSDISNNNDLEPAKKSYYLGRAGELATKQQLDLANVQKVGAQTNLYTVEAQTKLKNAFYLAQQEVNTMKSMIGQPGGPPDQATADQLANQIYERTARETATGISAEQETANALTTQRQAVDQGNNRASTAASYFNTSLSEASKLNASLPAGSDLGGKGFLAMLHMAPGFQSSMGGAPVDISPGQKFALNAAQQIAQKYNIPLSQAAQSVRNSITGNSGLAASSDMSGIGPDTLPNPNIRATTPNPDPSLYGQAS